MVVSQLVAAAASSLFERTRAREGLLRVFSIGLSRLAAARRAEQSEPFSARENRARIGAALIG